MDIDSRIRQCRIIEKMNNNYECCKRIGLENSSSFNGQIVNNKNLKCGGKTNGPSNQK